VLVLEKEKSKGSILFIVLIIISIAAYVVSGFIFHSTDVKSATYYDPDWFIDNSRASKPPFLNITPPYMPNVSMEYFFLIDGKAPTLAWRLGVLSIYIDGWGWQWGYNSISEYSIPEEQYNVTYIVRTPLLPVSGTLEYPLVTLWDNSANFSCSDFEIYMTDLSSFETYINLWTPDMMLVFGVNTPEQGSIGLKYIVGYRPINRDVISENSATIEATNNTASTDPVLRNYTMIPEGYFARYPEVKDLMLNVSLSSNNTVYEQVGVIVRYLVENFEVKDSLVITDDPIADFVRSKGGPLIGFANVTALLLRAMGIPTRLVIGFVGGEYDSSIDKTVLALEDSYVWVEVWDANNGWVPYDVLPRPSLAENLVSFFAVNINAPRSIYGMPAVYVNESLDIELRFYGSSFYGFEGQNVYFYDITDSVVLGNATISEIYENVLSASISIRYEDIQALIDGITYGVHEIEISIFNLRIYVKIVLLRQTVIV